MSLAEAIKDSEDSLIKILNAKRSGIDDRTGKGSATERVVEEQLLTPHLPSGLRLCKGAVVEAMDPSHQSPAFDRVIYDHSAASPLLYDEAHSIFPLEAVCGLVEITMNLEATKLREDIERMVSVKAMTKRRYLVPVPNSSTRVLRTEQDALSPRSFIIGLPADPSWSPVTIAAALRRIQQDLGPPTHVHGLYVIGVGFFQTVAIDSPWEPMYRIGGWTGPDRLFRFTTAFRIAFDRWGALPTGWSVDLHDYVAGQWAILAE
jgi:hypothetical protein